MNSFLWTYFTLITHFITNSFKLKQNILMNWKIDKIREFELRNLQQKICVREIDNNHCSEFICDNSNEEKHITVFGFNQTSKGFSFHFFFFK